MNVYEYRVKLKLKKDLNYKDLSSKLNYFLDSVLTDNEKFLKYHETVQYKGYVHDLLYPIEESGKYLKDKIYTMRIRMVDKDLLQHLSGKLAFHETNEMKSVGSDIRILPRKNIQQIYSITPVIIKGPGKGYWKNYMDLRDFEKRLKDNLIKKYKFFTGNSLNEEFELYTFIEFKNNVPVKNAYKNINLLGDKICLEISQNKQAQELAYLALGVGLLENNSRGFGFVNFK